MLPHNVYLSYSEADLLFANPSGELVSCFANPNLSVLGSETGKGSCSSTLFFSIQQASQNLTPSNLEHEYCYSFSIGPAPNIARNPKIAETEKKSNIYFLAFILFKFQTKKMEYVAVTKDSDIKLHTFLWIYELWSDFLYEKRRRKNRMNEQFGVWRDHQK